jgi:two-component system LytT family response regulator
VRVLIVDDEEPARAKLRTLLAGEPEVELAGEARDGLEAVAWLLAQEADVVFLDVKMPRCGGFEVVEHVGVERMPLVVFATAYDEHALRAFEVAAVDYLLKPFARQRLRAVLARVRTRLGERRAARSAALARAVTAASPPPFLTRLLVERAPGREVLLELAHVSFVRAAGNYLEFHADGTTYLRRAPSPRSRPGSTALPSCASTAPSSCASPPCGNSSPGTTATGAHSSTTATSSPGAAATAPFAPTSRAGAEGSASNPHPATIRRSVPILSAISSVRPRSGWCTTNQPSPTTLWVQSRRICPIGLSSTTGMQ